MNEFDTWLVLPAPARPREQSEVAPVNITGDSLTPIDAWKT
jgi:hypothetical protein